MLPDGLCHHAAMGRRKKKKRGLRPASIVGRILLALLVLQAVYLALLRVMFPPLTITQAFAAVETRRLERDYVALEAIPAHARLAVIAAEDQRFALHGGFDWRSVRAALRHNEQHPARARGASTITQQVAKNIFLWQAKSWLRKGLEAYFTVLLEVTLDKRRILELYLNIAEMGPGVFGIEAAARHYFGKPARGLTPEEAALIAACLPNPKVYRADRPSRRVRAKAEWILGQARALRGSHDIAVLLR
jgi:monofunctional glycosyltransferase